MRQNLKEGFNKVEIKEVFMVSSIEIKMNKELEDFFNNSKSNIFSIYRLYRKSKIDLSSKELVAVFLKANN